MRLKKLMIIGCMFFIHNLIAQDIHFTQYNLAPLTVNPALTGNFEGTFRLHGIQRVQEFATSDIDGYSTLNLSGEYNLPIRPRGNDWIGVGLNFYNDKAGSTDRKANIYSANIGYHFALDKEISRFFSIGAHYGAGNISYNNAGRTATVIKGGTSTNTINENTNMSDLALGIGYTIRNNGSRIVLGASVENIPGKKDINPLGLNAHIDYSKVINEQSSWDAGIWLFNQSSETAFNLQGKYNIKPNPAKDLTLSAGLGTRSFKNAFLLLGAQFKNFNVGLSYDMDISGLSNANSSYKGLEIGVGYILKIFQKPTVTPIIFCPRL